MIEAGAPIGIIAGGGELPHLVVAAARSAGYAPFVVAIADGRNADWGVSPVSSLPWSKTGEVFPLLARRGIRHVVFCGTISARPDYRSLTPSLRTLRLLPEILKMLRGGDDSLLRGVASLFERRGIEVLPVQAVLRDALMPHGVLTRRTPTDTERLAVERAADAARQIGRMDIGQAVVASADRVIAVEGIEGTSAMLRRVAELRQAKRIGQREACVLFKAFKPQQDERFDLPSIGHETVLQATEAGLAGVGLTAGRSLLIDPARIVDDADRAGLFVLGVADPTEGGLQ
ncbi:UDP-2,3-diacylglucosamine diphosphatase LpxI [Aureimonas sp. ME7]|uniref:LpxI family protein n=1 Tax=Aureimonas sp. ME7 TaxID=2744252 RepID=UPI0015F431CC|nr:UDP-2,3-diacylglucosamine diphosphatase LpxI [Aureimonas sp. ME7]